MFQVDGKLLLMISKLLLFFLALFPKLRPLPRKLTRFTPRRAVDQVRKLRPVLTAWALLKVSFPAYVALRVGGRLPNLVARSVYLVCQKLLNWQFSGVFGL